MSTMASCPPTSWKWTWSSGRRWSAASTSASASKTAERPLGDPVGERGPPRPARRCAPWVRTTDVVAARRWPGCRRCRPAAPPRPRASQPPTGEPVEEARGPRRGRRRRRRGSPGPCRRRCRRSSGTRRPPPSLRRSRSREEPGDGAGGAVPVVDADDGDARRRRRPAWPSRAVTPSRAAP